MVLIIEDDAQLALMLRMFFEDEGFASLYAESAEEGLALDQERRPEIIVCDLYLPGISGLMLAAAIKADPALAHTYLIAITGSPSCETSKEALGAGFDLFIAKPFHPAELVEQVQRIEYKMRLLEEAGW